MTSITFKLGGRTFEARPLTLDQLSRALPPSLDINKPLAEGGFDACRSIISVALEGQIDAAELADLPVTLGDVLAATAVIGRVSGLLTPGEPLGGMGGPPA